jgi:hypothetical protein
MEQQSSIRQLAQTEIDKLMQARRLQKYFRVSKHNYARRLRFWAKMKKQDRA